MTIDLRTFWLAKRGNSPEEYEDAFAADASLAKFAVADGATESGFAKQWARLLVQQFVETSACAPQQWVRSLPAIQQQWLAEVSGHELPWYAEAKVNQGAFATFLGLSLSRRRRGRYRWQAVAVGDSCVFHTNGKRLIHSFPVPHSDEFGNTPWLVGSRTPLEKLTEERLVWERGAARRGDRFWLMTDALAQWFLLEYETGQVPWEELDGILAREDASAEFAAWIEDLRDAKRLHNDDVTLLAIVL